MVGTQRLALRLQACALALLGLSLLGAGVLIWQHGTQGAAHAAMIQALQTETQALAAQTKVLLERLHQR